MRGMSDKARHKGGWACASNGQVCGQHRYGADRQQSGKHARDAPMGGWQRVRVGGASMIEACAMLGCPVGGASMIEACASEGVHVVWGTCAQWDQTWGRVGHEGTCGSRVLVLVCCACCVPRGVLGWARTYSGKVLEARPFVLPFFDLTLPLDL